VLTVELGHRQGSLRLGCRRHIKGMETWLKEKIGLFEI
jgi:hypothetical protein